MKSKKSISKILLSLLLCICLMPLPFGVMAASDVTVKVSGGSQISFDEATTEYAVTVPVWYETGVDNYTYNMPAITVTNAGEPVVVTMPDTLPGEASFEIGGSTYTIALGLAKNMYENGGFEKSSHDFVRSDSGAGTRVSTIGYTGSCSYEVPATKPAAGVLHTVEKQLQQGKTYLSSYATRQSSDETLAQPFRATDRVYSQNTAEAANVKFYRDGVLLKTSESLQKHDADYFDLTSKWSLMQVVITPTTETYTIDIVGSAPAGHFNSEAVGRQVARLHDDLFLGELAVGKIDVTDKEGNRSSVLLSGVNEAKTLELTGVLLNQLGNNVGFENKALSWTCVGPADGVTVENGVVTVPAGQAAGEYIITASADLSDINNIGTVSASYTLTVNSVQSGDLSELSVDGSGLDLSGFAFNPSVTEYTVGVPVRYFDGVDSYEYTMPVISAEAADETQTAVVTMPSALPGTATIEVKNEEDILKTYSVNLVALGTNMYANGGAETGSRGSFKRDDAALGFEITNADAYSGTKSMIRPSNYTLAPYYYLVDGIEADVVLKKGKPYLASYATRLKPDVTMATGKEYRLMDAIESPNEGESATASFYLDGKKTGEVTETGKSAFKDTGILMSHDWKQLQAVVEPASDSFTIWHYSLDKGWDTNRRYDLLLDDVFVGELIIGGVQLIDAYGAKLPTTLSSTQGHTITIGAEAVNQLGNNVGLEDKVALSDITAVDLPEGVTFENNVLAFNQGATGVVTLSVTATPSGNWTPQSAFTETIKLNLVNGSFAYIEKDGKVISILSHYTGNSALDAELYHAIYSKNGTSLKLMSVVKESVSGYNDEFLYKETDLNVAEGQVVKSFLWMNGTGLIPHTANGVFER